MEIPGNVVQVDEMAAVGAGMPDRFGRLEHIAFVGQHEHEEQIETDQTGQGTFHQPVGYAFAGRLIVFYSPLTIRTRLSPATRQTSAISRATTIYSIDFLTDIHHKGTGHKKLNVE